MGIYANDVQKLYIAYFNRPADPVGLAYWEEQITKNGGSTAAVANAFSASNEYKSLYAGKSSAQIVETIYQNLFGRSAEASGLTYWAVRLENGTFNVGNIAVSILVGAQNDDKKVVDNKVTVATAFTTALDTSAEILAYAGDAAAASARTFLATVGATDASLTTAKAAVDSTISSIATTTVSNGSTLNLTTGTDSFVGTANNDTINASTGLSADGSTAIATTNALDVIDGGAGVDTLNIENTGGKNTLTGTVTNVENLTFIGAGNVNNNADVSVASFSGTVTLKQTDDTAVKFTNVKGQTLALNTVADGTVVTAVLDAAQTSSTLTNAAAVGNATFSISGTKLDTVNITTDKTATGKALTVTDTGNTTKTANIAASGAAAVTVNSTSLETVKVTGAGAVTLAAGTAPSKVLDASGSTGGVTYAVDLVDQQFTGSSAKDTVQFGATTKAQTLGAGDDVVTMSVAALGAGGSIDGGEGTDTIILSAANAATATSSAVLGAAFAASISGFDKFGLLDAGAAKVVDAQYIDGITYITSVGSSVGGLTINNAAGGSTLELTGGANVAGVTYNLKDATSTSDSINLIVKHTADGAFGSVTAAGVETLNITSTDSNKTVAGTVDHSLTVVDTSAKSIVITGNAHLTLTQASTVLTSVDASGMTVASATTGADTLGLNFSTGALADTYATATDGTTTVTIKGTDGVDVISGAAVVDATVKLVITGGLGGKVGATGDTLTGGAGADTITASGLGNHALSGGGGKDTITGAAGDDTITGGAAADTLTGNGGNDKFVFTLAADSAPTGYDTITDFVAKTATANGDVLQFAVTAFGGAAAAFGAVFVADNGTLALAALSSNADHTAEKVFFALDKATGTLYIDGTGAVAGTSDGTADMAIVLTGVTTIDTNAITFA